MLLPRSQFPILIVAGFLSRLPRYSAHRDRADAGHDLTIGQVTVAHQPLASIVGKLVGMAPEKPGHLRCDGLGQKRAGTAAQNLRQRVGKRAWLAKLENITVGHGVSLLRWRSGGARTPTIRRPTLACRHQLLPLARLRAACYPPRGPVDDCQTSGHGPWNGHLDHSPLAQ